MIILLFLGYYIHQCVGDVTISRERVPGSANPVLLFHGLMDNYKTMERMADKIVRDYPGTYTHSIKVLTIRIACTIT